MTGMQRDSSWTVARARLLLTSRGPRREAGRYNDGQEGETRTQPQTMEREPLGCVTEVLVALGLVGVRAGGVGATAAYLFLPRRASTSSSGFSECHWAMGLLGLASMSDQCRSSVPVALLPTKILPMASFLPSLS